jgi:hypothetical protein
MFLSQKFPVQEKVEDGSGGGGATEPQILEHEEDGKKFRFKSTFKDGELKLEPVEHYPELDDEGFSIKISKNIKKEQNRVQQTNQEKNLLKKQNAEYDQKFAEQKKLIDDQRILMEKYVNSGGQQRQTQPDAAQFNAEDEMFKLAKVENWEDYADLSDGDKAQISFTVNQMQNTYKAEQSKKEMATMFSDNFATQQADTAFMQTLMASGHSLPEAKAWLANQGLPVNASSIEFFQMKHKRNVQTDPFQKENKIASLFNSIPEEFRGKGDIPIVITKPKDALEQERQRILDA